jgi:hypothetical protein
LFSATVEVNWRSPVDGDWNDGTKWDANRAPCNTEIAVLVCSCALVPWICIHFDVFCLPKPSSEVLYNISIDDEHVAQGIEFGTNGVLEFSNNGRIYFELPSANPDSSCMSLKLNLVVDDVAASLALASWAAISGATGYEVKCINTWQFALGIDCRPCCR